MSRSVDSMGELNRTKAMENLMHCERFLLVTISSNGQRVGWNGMGGIHDILGMAEYAKHQGAALLIRSMNQSAEEE